MSDKVEVFAEAEVVNAREPRSTAAQRCSSAAPHPQPSSRPRPRRGPRKVVVYYFDSDSDSAAEAGADCEEVAAMAAKREADEVADGMDEFTNSGRSNSQMEVVQRRHVRCRSCACAATAGAATAPKPISPENPRIGSPTPIGFFAFGMTTLLYNVHNAKICQLNMATMGLVIMFGGLTQFLCGFFELINMNTLGCTISTTYGAFWMATAVLFLWPENAYVTMGDHSYTGGFFLLWFVFAGTLFASAFRSPFMCMALFFLVPLNFLLQSIGYFADSDVVARVAGYEGIIVGALATYLGMAFTLRDVYGRSLLPILFQKNMRCVEW